MISFEAGADPKQTHLGKFIKTEHQKFMEDPFYKEKEK